MLVLLLALSLCQTADGAEIRALVERLRSDNPKDRDEAAQKLKVLGKAALPELERGSAHPDPEGSRRAARLLKVIAIAEGLTPTIRKTFPGIEERLAAADLHGWTEEFLAICAETGKGKKYESLKPEDFRGLVGPAVRGARTDLEKSLICARAGILRLTSAAPELTPLLEDKDREVRRNVLRAFRTLEARDVSPQIVPLLKDESAGVRREAAETCGLLGATQAIRPLLPMMEDPDEETRWFVLQALTRLAAREAIPGMIVRLKDEAPFVRRYAAWALGELEAREAAAALVPVLGDPDQSARMNAAGALCRIGSFDGVRTLLDAAARDSNITLSILNELRAAETLKRLRRKECRWPFPDRKEAPLVEILRAVTGLEIDLSKDEGDLMTVALPRESADRWRTAADLAYVSPHFVLESDRIVYLSREESLRFWKEWAERHAPPKK